MKIPNFRTINSESLRESEITFGYFTIYIHIFIYILLCPGPFPGHSLAKYIRSRASSSSLFRVWMYVLICGYNNIWSEPNSIQLLNTTGPTDLFILGREKQVQNNNTAIRLHCPYLNYMWARKGVDKNAGGNTHSLAAENSWSPTPEHHPSTPRFVNSCHYYLWFLHTTMCVVVLIVSIQRITGNS